MTDSRRPSITLALAALVAAQAATAQVPARLASADPAPRREESIVRRSFVRDQALLGLTVYGPSFAATIANEPVGWAAAYLVAGGGSYFAASQLSRDVAINEPTSWLATQTAVRGGLAGLAIANAAGANRHHRAAGLFFGSIGGTAAAVVFGRGMTDGQVAASVFGADLAALSALGATHMAREDMSASTRAATTAAAAIVGYPLGYWYARNASYRVNAGDVNTLWVSTAIGAMAGSAFVANGSPPSRAVATALIAGGLGGAVLGDRFLVRPLDHSPRDGQMVALGAAAGGLMGAGVAVLTGASRERVSAATAAFTAAGATAGVWVTEQLIGTSREAGRTVARVQVAPSGALAAAAGLPGTHTVLRLTF